MSQTKAESPVEHSRVHALGAVFTFHVLIGPSKELRICAYASLVDPPVSRLVVKWIRYLVNPEIFEKFPPQFAVNTATLHIRHITIPDVNLDPGKKAIVVA